MPQPPVRLTAAACALVVASTAFNAAPAATCTAEVMELARQYALSTELPEASPRQGVPMTPSTPPATLESRGFGGTDRTGLPLARSGGVIQPPDTGTMPTIAPPPGAGSNMPTAPGSLPPGPATPGAPGAPGPQGGIGGGAPGVATIEDREKAEALLTAARIADKEGRARDCEARLEEARNLLPPPHRG